MNQCPVCSANMSHVFDSMILNRHEVSYWQCKECGLLQTQQPHWLDEAYSDAIALADTGLVARNVMLASRLAVLLLLRFDPRACFLDVAGGYGMMTRLMRDYGFDYYWEDKYCQNYLAKGFCVDRASRPFCAMTAFEVLEHVHDPLAFIRELFERHACRTLVFTTELYSGDEPPGKDWWYYTFSTGQHITFFKRKTLEVIAEKLDVDYYSVNQLHILTDKKISTGMFLTLLSGKFNWIGEALVRRKLESLTMSDHMLLIGQHMTQRQS